MRVAHAHELRLDAEELANERLRQLRADSLNALNNITIATVCQQVLAAHNMALD